jgi:hypothetical protein
VKIRFQADADLNESIVKGLLRREPGIDFQTASAAALRNRTDFEVLSLAARGNRIVVSHDWRTMPRHFAEFTQQKQSAGLILVPQDMNILSAIEDLKLIWLASQAEDWINRIVRLPL